MVAYAVRPDADEAELARRVNTASSYPEQVREARTDLLERVRIRLEHDGVERLLAERIPRENLETISEEGYLDEFDIDIGAAIERKHGDGPGSPPARIDRPARTAGDELPEGRADDTPGEASGDDRRHGAGHERSGSSGGASAGGDDPEHRGDHGGGEFDGSSLEVSSQDGVGESSGTGSGRTVDRREVAGCVSRSRSTWRCSSARWNSPTRRHSRPEPRRVSSGFSSAWMGCYDRRRVVDGPAWPVDAGRCRRGFAPGFNW